MSNLILEPNTLKVTGKVHILLRDREGRPLQVVDIPNTVTDAGKAHIADQLSRNPGEAKINNIAIGTGTPSSTALGSESYRKYIKTITESGAVVTYFGHWDIDDNIAGSFTEAGLFNLATIGGTMLCSTTFDAITKAKDDILDITWSLTIT